jgi:hypothetical protein
MDIYMNKWSAREATRKLEHVFSTGSGSSLEQTQMLELIEAIESQLNMCGDPKLQYWLGVANTNYVSWYVRGDKRKPFLERAVTHYERAYMLEKDFGGSKWHEYAGAAGKLLVEEAVIRNLQKGLLLLEAAFSFKQTYEPYMCWYAEGIYKSGSYAHAAEVAMELHLRAANSIEWKSGVPQMPMMIVVKSLRALIRLAKKAKNISEAYSISEKLLKTGAASENDRKIHEQLYNLAY